MSHAGIARNECADALAKYQACHHGMMETAPELQQPSATQAWQSFVDIC